MKLVIFGLSVSSAWGNGHATLWRGLFRSLARFGYCVHFFEKDTPYYSAHRDACSVAGARIHYYSDWQQVRAEARRELDDADIGMTTSYCPDGAVAAELVWESNARRSAYYDLDTPVTLSKLSQGEAIRYLPPYGLGNFDLVLSYTGGQALVELRDRLGAKRVAPLYGCVDPDVHRPRSSCEAFASDLSYLGTYAPDRQAKLEELLLRPAELLPNARFVLAGAMYPPSLAVTPNVQRFEHIVPGRHADFYSSSRITLNLTRGSMAEKGYCPSGRLFEAAACGSAILSDWWPGLDQFFAPGEEILIADSREDSCRAVLTDEADLARIASRARERTLACHTAAVRAAELNDLLESCLNVDTNESVCELAGGA
jgi:spore maturation protein CgeB